VYTLYIDYIDLRVGFSWTCASYVEIDRDWNGYVALTNDRFMKLFDKLISVIADFKEFKADLDYKKMSVGSPKRKKTAPSKSVEVKASVPNPNLASNIFTQSVTAAVSASTGAGGPKASLTAVPIFTKSSGGVPVSAQLSVPTGEVSSIGVPSLDNQTNDVQIAGGGRKSLSVVPYRKQLLVSRLTPETASADVFEFIQQKFPSRIITVEEFKFPYVRRISSFKISAPPEVFN